MNNNVYEDIYINQVNKFGCNYFGIDCVKIYKCKNGTILALSSEKRLVAITTSPLTGTEDLRIIENGRGFLALASILEDSYKSVDKCMESLGYSINEVIDLKMLIQDILSMSPYWTKYAVQWIEDAPNLRFTEFAKEIDKISKSPSYTKAFKDMLRNKLSNESVQTVR